MRGFDLQKLRRLNHIDRFLSHQRLSLRNSLPRQFARANGTNPSVIFFFTIQSNTDFCACAGAAAIYAIPAFHLNSSLLCFDSAQYLLPVRVRRMGTPVENIRAAKSDFIDWNA